MEITQTLTFDQYWESLEFRDKRPVRNGSRVMMVGDNIYHRAEAKTDWHQLDSHHSLQDGSPNVLNVRKDTSVNRVLISHNFFYFGTKAPYIPRELLEHLGFRNGIGYRVFDAQLCVALIRWIASHRGAANIVFADPFDFKDSEMRYAGKGSSVA